MNHTEQHLEMVGQEPVAYLSEGGHFSFEPWQGSTPLYKHPAKREWQGLTTDDIKGLCANNIPSTWDIGLCRLVEKFLKEKNA